MTIPTDVTAMFRDHARALGARVADGSNVIRIHDRTRVRCEHTERFFDWLREVVPDAKNDPALMQLIDRQLKLFGKFVEETMADPTPDAPYDADISLLEDAKSELERLLDIRKARNIGVMHREWRTRAHLDLALVYLEGAIREMEAING